MVQRQSDELVIVKPQVAFRLRGVEIDGEGLGSGRWWDQRGESRFGGRQCGALPSGGGPSFASGMKICVYVARLSIVTAARPRPSLAKTTGVVAGNTPPAERPAASVAGRFAPHRSPPEGVGVPLPLPLARRTRVRYRWSMADLSPEEAEVLRRSIAMLPPQAPSGLSRERALAILGQLVRALRELRRR